MVLFLLLLSGALVLSGCGPESEVSRTAKPAAPAAEAEAAAAAGESALSVPEQTATPADAVQRNEQLDEPQETTPSADPPEEVEAQTTRKPATAYADLEIVTLLPRDAIPAIDNPQFLSASEADAFYDADELILGVSFNGDSRAYSVPFLSNHEIVNDTVGGVKLAATW